MTANDRQEALDTARGLTGALAGMQEELQRLNAYGRRSRRLVMMAFVSVALDICLTVLLVLTYGAAHNSQVEAKAARNIATVEHQSLIAGCVAGNVFRAENVQLWDHLAAISKPPPHLTRAALAKNKAEIRALLAYIAKTFAPRNCQQAYRLP